jgi:PAS domain S-box-containing protein
MGARSSLLDTFGDDFAWSLLEAAPDGILLVDRAGVVVFVSSQAAALFATLAEDLLGRQVEELVPEDVRPTHRAHRSRFQAAPTVRSMGAGLLLRARRVDGTEFPVEISLSPITMGGDVFTVAALRDVTDRVETEDYLHRVMATLDATDDGVFIFDADSLRYSYVNEGAVRLVGYNRDELLTMTPLHLNPSARREDYRELVATLRASPEQAITRRAVMIGRDGSDVPVEKTYQSAPVGRDRTRWIIALARDVSVRLAAEEELRRSQEALRAAGQVLVLAEDRERIARDLHDTVIQRLFGAGLQLQATLGSADARTRERLEGTVVELDDTIRELRSAIFALHGPSPALGGLRGRLVDILADAARALGFEPRLQLDGPIETIDEMIAENLLAVLREALANVARHARAQSVRVTIGAGGEVVLTVVDDGIGVPDEVLGGEGLTNLAGRAEELGGSFEIVRGPERGSRLEWRVPSSGGVPGSATR